MESVTTPEGRQKARVEKAVDAAADIAMGGSDQASAERFAEASKSAMVEIEKLREAERVRGVTGDSEFIKVALSVIGRDEDIKE